MDKKRGLAWRSKRIEYAPCMDCTERHLACHDTCPKYSEYKRQRNEWLREQHNNTSLDRIGHTD